MIETIPNNYPQLTMRVSLSHTFARLCPISGEPQPSSTITISYEAGACLLETKALRRYLKSFAGENEYGVRDLEEAVQVIAQSCADVLAVQVVARAYYELSIGSMDVEVIAMPKNISIPQNEKYC
jgi:NADPH-dependent 7-cyano-7-deazaguanine reductase QueF